MNDFDDRFVSRTPKLTPIHVLLNVYIPGFYYVFLGAPKELYLLHPVPSVDITLSLIALIIAVTSGKLPLLYLLFLACRLYIAGRIKEPERFPVVLLL